MPPPRAAAGRQIDAGDAAAAAVWAALEAALVEQRLALADGDRAYEISSLVCQSIAPPPPTTALYDCKLDYRVGATGPFTSVTIAPSSSKARPLFDALHAAGGDPSMQKYSLDLRLANARVTRTKTSFEDRSKTHEPPVPNVEVTGAPAKAVLDALVTAGVHDADGTLFLLCTAAKAPPACSYWSSAVGSGTPSAPTKVDATTSSSLWSAVTRAGAIAGTHTDGNGAAPPALFNARAFTWDGTTLRIHLTLSNVTPPSPPG